jgi:hypothetical protein
MSRGTLAGDASRVLAGGVGIAGRLVAAGTERYCPRQRKYVEMGEHDGGPRPASVTPTTLFKLAHDPGASPWWIGITIALLGVGLVLVSAALGG